MMLVRRIDKTGEVQIYPVHDQVAIPGKRGPAERPRRSRAWRFDRGFAAVAPTVTTALELIEKEMTCSG